MYKAAIFDFGNTLASTASLSKALESVVPSRLATKAGSFIESEIAAMYIPTQKTQPDWLDIWQRSFDKVGLPFDEQLGREHLEAFCRMSKTFPDVPDLLAQLKKQNVKLGLLSNVTGPAEIFQADLERRGLAGFFDAVIWSSAIGYRKPAAESFQAVLDELKVKPVESLMIGDSELADIEGANKIKIDTALVTNNPVVSSKATYRLRSNYLLHDLLAVLNFN